MYDIIHDIMACMISYMISYLILDMISCLKMHFSYFLCTAATDPRPTQHVDETNDDNEPGRAMDIDKERDFADQGPPGSQTWTWRKTQRFYLFC